MDNSDYEVFAARYPSSSRLVENLARMEAAISSGPFAPFFEPVALLDDLGPKTSPKLLGPLAPYLEAWTCHIAYGTTARVRGLSGAVLRQLLENRLSIASILQRTIMEHAGRAAFGVCRVTDCSRNKKWDEMRGLIPKTLFGTSMTALDDTLFEDFADWSAQRPVKPGDFINALRTAIIRGSFDLE